MNTGVYRIITPSVNDFVYIGSAARSLARRWIVHQSALRKGLHHAPLLQAVVRRYGLQVLRFEVIERCAPCDCIPREQFWIDASPSHRLYNVNPRAESRLGSKFTEHQRRQLIRSHGGIDEPEIIAQLVSEYTAGAKQALLAQKYKVTRGTIRNYICRSEAAIRPLPTRNEALRVEIAEAYAAGRGVKQLAKIYHLDYDTIMRILTRAGATMRSSSARQKLRFQDIERRKRLSMMHGGKIWRFLHRTHGLFTGYAVELARQFGLSVHNINAVARGARPAHKGWEIFTGDPHVWKRPEHRQYPRGAEHPMTKKFFDVETRQAMARRNRKCSEEQIIQIRKMLQAGMRQKQIAKDFGIDQSVISRISTGARWYRDFVD